MAGSTFRGSYEGIGELLRSEMMRGEMVRRAERVANLARAIAPVYKGPDDPHRGRYKASIHVTSTNRGGWRSDRAAGLVVADAPEAWDVEFGNSRQEGHHTLRSALGAAGD